MEIANKELQSGFKMPEFGLGTWHMGGALSTDTTNDEGDKEGIRNALNSGISLIDTAELYGLGHAEELVGEVISELDRSKLFIVSKVYIDNLAYEDVLKACERSLNRLGTGYLDAYLVHIPNPNIPIAETMRALDKLKEEEKIRAIGVSNFTIEQMEEAQASTKNKIEINQIHFNLAYQKWQDVVDYCQANDIMVMCYRPVERGVMTKNGIPILDEMSKKYDKTPAQIAINWLISQKNMVAVCKTSSKEHLGENLGALGWRMNEEDLGRLGKEFPEVEIPGSSLPFKVQR